MGSDTNARRSIEACLNKAANRSGKDDCAKIAGERGLNWQFVLCGDGDDWNKVKNSAIGLTNIFLSLFFIIFQISNAVHQSFA